MMQDHEYLLSTEAAELRRCRPQTLRRERWRGGGPPYLKVNNRILYPRAELLAWLERHRVGSTSDRTADATAKQQLRKAGQR